MPQTLYDKIFEDHVVERQGVQRVQANPNRFACPGDVGLVEPPVMLATKLERTSRRRDAEGACDDCGRT
jgi:hypothetical protein